jgi:hypothetical protein
MSKQTDSDTVYVTYDAGLDEVMSQCTECKHKVVCSECISDIDKCPTCQTKIKPELVVDI